MWPLYSLSYGADSYRVRNANERHGIDFLVGYETEFILIPKEGRNRDQNEWCASKASLTGSTEYQILMAIEASLKKSNIELQYWHSESAPGQVKSFAMLVF
jgi:glutamine synthetase